MYNRYYDEKFREACHHIMLPVDDMRDAFGLAAAACTLALRAYEPEIDDDHRDAFERFKEMNEGKGVREMDTDELGEFSTLLHELAFYFAVQSAEHWARVDQAST